MTCIISKNPALIFIHIPKNGGRHFSAKLKEITSLKSIDMFIDEHIPTHISIKELSDRGILKKYFPKDSPKIICLVRNPYAKMYSLYKFLLESSVRRIKNRLLFNRKKRENKGLSMIFDIKRAFKLKVFGFNNWLLNDGYRKHKKFNKNHTRDQISYVERSGFDSLESVIFIRFENFDKDIVELESLTGACDWSFKSYESDYKKHYSKESRAKVHKTFKRDLDLFGYKF